MAARSFTTWSSTTRQNPLQRSSFPKLRVHVTLVDDSFQALILKRDFEVPEVAGEWLSIKSEANEMLRIGVTADSLVQIRVAPVGGDLERHLIPGIRSLCDKCLNRLAKERENARGRNT